MEIIIYNNFCRYNYLELDVFKLEGGREMNRLLKNSHALIFCLAVILVLSTILPIPSLAATSTAKQNWKVTTNGEPLFEPLVQSNGSLLFGNYKIVKSVYNTEIMNISTKGKISGKWSLKADKVELGGTDKSPKIIAISRSKGIVTSYSTTGKKLWSYNFKTKIDWETWYSFDQNGNFYLFNDSKVTKVSASGKLLYKKAFDGGYISPKGEIYNVKFNGENPAKTNLIKLSTTGKTVINTNPFSNDKDLQYFSGTNLVDVTDNYIYLTATYYDEAQGDGFYKLIILNKNGNLVGSSIIESYDFSVTEYKGSIYVVDQQNLYKLNAKGSITKTTRLTGKTPYGTLDNIYFLQATDKGEIFGTASNNILKFTSSGTLDSKIYNAKYINDLFLFNGKQYVTISGDKYVYIYDSKGKKVSKSLWVLKQVAHS